MNERIDTTAAVTAFTAAFIGGAVSYAKNNRPFSWLRITANLFMSGFAGLLCWHACDSLNLHGPITAICTGLAGHIGAEITQTIELNWKRK